MYRKWSFKLNIPNYTITCNDRPRMQRGRVAMLVRNNIKFDTLDKRFTIKTDNEAIAIILKESQLSSNILNMYIPLASSIDVI